MFTPLEFVCVRLQCVCTHGSWESLCELIVSFHGVGSKDETQVLSLGTRNLNLPIEQVLPLTF